MPEMTEEVAESAEQIRDRLVAMAKQIKANTDLTPEGQKRQLDEIHSQAREDMDNLREGWNERGQGDATSAARDILGGGYGSDPINMRDAMDRAQRLSAPDEAARLVESASLISDYPLIRAVAYEAYQRSQTEMFGNRWLAVVDECIKHVTTLGPHFKKVMSSTRRSDPSALMQFMLPPRSTL